MNCIRMKTVGRCDCLFDFFRVYVVSIGRGVLLFGKGPSAPAEAVAHPAEPSEGEASVTFQDMQGLRVDAFRARGAGDFGDKPMGRHSVDIVSGGADNLPSLLRRIGGKSLHGLRQLAGEGLDSSGQTVDSIGQTVNVGTRRNVHRLLVEHFAFAREEPIRIEIGECAIYTPHLFGTNTAHDVLNETITESGRSLELPNTYIFSLDIRGNPIFYTTHGEC